MAGKPISSVASVAHAVKAWENIRDKTKKSPLILPVPKKVIDIYCAQTEEERREYAEATQFALSEGGSYFGRYMEEAVEKMNKKDADTEELASFQEFLAAAFSFIHFDRDAKIIPVTQDSYERFMEEFDVYYQVWKKEKQRGRASPNFDRFTSEALCQIHGENNFLYRFIVRHPKFGYPAGTFLDRAPIYSTAEKAALAVRFGTGMYKLARAQLEIDVLEEQARLPSYKKGIHGRPNWRKR